MAQINLVDNTGDGYNDRIDIQEDETLASFFARQKPSSDISEFTLRVNNESRPASYILEHNDRVTFTPRKVEGATSA